MIHRLPGHSVFFANTEMLDRSHNHQEEFRRLATKTSSIQGRLQDPGAQWQLRMKFLEQAKSYIGVPYAQKYHEPGTPEYESPLFLDCCGFIRRVMLDLSEDFGFSIGPGNQAYQYDTLPITLPSEEHLKPGDLVFISGAYFDTQRKGQPHDIVHVEIWLGDGERSLGARWKRGKVQVFDSYKFVSTSYGGMEYHFKSIETWLQGVCTSHCPEHKWASSRQHPGWRSIFHPKSDQDEPAEEDVGGEGDLLQPQPGKEEVALQVESIVDSISGSGLGDSKQMEALDLQGFSPRRPGVTKRIVTERGQAVEVKQGQSKSMESSGPSVGWSEALLEGKPIPTEGFQEGPTESPATSHSQEADAQVRPTGLAQDSPVNVSKKSRSTSKLSVKGAVTGSTNKRKKKGKPGIQEEGPHFVGSPSVDAGWMDERPLEACEKASALRLGFHWYPYCDHAGETRRGTAKAQRRTGRRKPRVQSAPLYKRRDSKCVTSKKEKPAQMLENQMPEDVKVQKQRSNPNLAEGEPTSETKPKVPKNIAKATPRMSQQEEKKPEEVLGSGPFFYIGGANGVDILNLYCKNKGWQRIYDNRRDDYLLKWSEIKFRDTYYAFKEGEQLLYQIPNNKILTTKIGLLMNLREYERVMRKVNRVAKLLRLEDFFPETFRLDTKDERELFFETYKEPHIWICKPTSSNQGRGIFLLKNQVEVNDLQARLQSIEEDPVYKKLPYRIPPARIVQRYIDRPLLLEGKKFDVRSYLLISCTMPYMLFFGHGYVRLTCLKYDSRSEDLTSHLTNQYVQKKSPLYPHVKEETVWCMDRFNTYVNEKFREIKGLPKDWVFNGFTKRMKEIMLQCFLAVKSKLDCKLGYFDLIGCDFLIDEDFKVWLLEMNSNPALHTNCNALKSIIPLVVNETLDLVIEIFTKIQNGQNLLPLDSLYHFVLLYNGSASDSGLSQVNRSRTSLRFLPSYRSHPEVGSTDNAANTTGATNTAGAAGASNAAGAANTAGAGNAASSGNTINASNATNNSSRSLDKQPPKALEKAPKGEDDKCLTATPPEGLSLPPGKGTPRDPLPMPQIQISIVPNLSGCPSVKATPRGNQVCNSGSQYIVRHVPETPESDGSDDQGKANPLAVARGLSKDKSYAAWFQQTFGTKLTLGPSSNGARGPLTSSQMLSLHLQSDLPPSLPKFQGPPKSYWHLINHAKMPPDSPKAIAKAPNRSGDDSLSEEKKTSHRGS